MSRYDEWLQRQADEYYSGCEPELDRDDEYTKCLNCDSKDECELYQELIN